MRKKIGINKLTIKQITILLAIILFCIVVEAIILVKSEENRVRRERDAARVYGESVATGILLTLNQTVNSTQVLKNMYNEYGNNITSDFDRTCNIFIQDNDLITGMFIAPDGIIEYAFPSDVNKATIGFKMLEDPEQGASARLAKETRKATVAGPHALVEGSVGFIVRDPLYNGDDFIAFSIAVINWKKFTKKVLEKISEYNSGYHFCVWKDDNSHVITDQNGCIIADSDKKISRDVDIPMYVPNDVWHLSVEPEGGWKKNKGMLAHVLGAIIIDLVIIMVILFMEITENNRLFLFEHDSLTGMYTRSAFYRRVTKIFKEQPDVQFDIIVADIENFKVVNSVHGTKKCDELLCYLGDCYKVETNNLICARYGGDVFICLFPDSENRGLEYLESRNRAIIEDGPIPDIVIKYGLYKNVDKTIPINLICDRALMAAKSILHNFDVTLANYEGPVSKRHIREQMYESSFESALKNNDFQVWYQPKFDAKTEKLVGAEALVRWVKEDGTRIPPNDFIYIFEDDGLIIRLDEYVFRTVCETISTWVKQGIKVVPISVNLSKTTLHHKGIVQKYKSIVDEVGIPIECVSLELTESSSFSNLQIKELADELKTAGFTIDMDDFGTGSSSLASLNMLPFDVIKIDKSLIDFIGTPDGDEMVRHTIEIAHFKKMRVVAEGVETKVQLEFLRKLGCDVIQGYYFLPPMSYEDCVIKFKELYKEGRV